jgi:5-methylcytosine-specific restriction endonuclease McrA
MKICSKCRTPKDFAGFSKDSTRVDGLDPHCKDCKAQYRKMNKERLREKSKTYYQENKEIINTRNNAYYASNGEKVKAHRQENRAAKFVPKQLNLFKWDDLRAEYNRTYQIKNKENIKVTKKSYTAREKEKIKQNSRLYRLANLEKKRKYHRKWQVNNPDRIRQYGSFRRANKRNNGGKFTALEWQQLKEKHNFSCLCCQLQEPEVMITPDHVIPLSKGGSNAIENIQPLCKGCNFKKHTESTDYRPRLVQVAG